MVKSEKAQKKKKVAKLLVTLQAHYTKKLQNNIY